jgi:anti-anti-sigma regulatory factor
MFRKRYYKIWRTVSFRMSKALHTKKSDLAYHIHDGSTALRFQLSGDLSGSGVRDLHQAWRTASSIIGGRCLVVDLSAVTGMDHAGRELLETWQVEGARTVATSSAAKARIESMMDRPVTLLGTNPKRYAWPPFCVAQRWVAALLALFFPAPVRPRP